jgi:hypothetical protein
MSTGNEALGVSDDKVASIFQADVLLSEQYFGNFRRRSYLEPEKRLMFAVLEDAIRCYQDNYISPRGKKKRHFEEVKEWLLSEDGDWVFSFENVCDVLGVNAAYIRHGLLRWKPSLSEARGFESARLAV